MILLSSIFQSVEFYVISVVVAAAIVAFMGRRPSAGPARRYAYDGVTTLEEPADSSPSIELLCGDDGSVVLRRRGLRGVRQDGRVVIEVEVVGFDVRITERVTAGRWPEPVDTASFILPFMGREHYFISYKSPLSESQEELMASLTLHNRPGNRVVRPLR